MGSSKSRFQWCNAMKFIRMPIGVILALCTVLYLVAHGLDIQPVKADNTESKVVKSEKAVKITGKSISLPHYPADFPPGPGRELFISRCGVCHSLRYVTMQPSFPEKTWAKEVDKMIKTYGAHIDKKEAKEIIEYLNSIKGKGPGKH